MGDVLGGVLLALVSLRGVDPAVARPVPGSRVAALARGMAARGGDPAAASELIARWPSPRPYRAILLYGDGPAVRVAARCLVLLRDRRVVETILERVERGELGAARHPAALFGWVVGASYDPQLMPRLRRLLASEDRLTRIFALEALRTLTYLRWRVPEKEPWFANPGEVWAMRRWCYQHADPETWLAIRLRPMLARIESPEERRAARRFLARFARD